MRHSKLKCRISGSDFQIMVSDHLAFWLCLRFRTIILQLQKSTGNRIHLKTHRLQRQAKERLIPKTDAIETQHPDHD